MPHAALKFEGKKFMWDGGTFSTGSEAKDKAAEYEKEGFETQRIEEDGQHLIYSRRIVTEIVLEEGDQPL